VERRTENSVHSSFSRHTPAGKGEEREKGRTKKIFHDRIISSHLRKAREKKRIIIMEADHRQADEEE
jgi:hypothetical protein